MNTLKITHSDGRTHQLGVCVSHEGRAQISLDEGALLTPIVGMSVDWGGGNRSPDVMLVYDWNGKKKTGDLRVCLFGGWLCKDQAGESRNWATFNGMSAEPPPETVYAKLGEFGHHEEHAPTGHDLPRGPDHAMGNC